MDLKQLLSDLYLGMKGFGSVLRIYGSRGSVNDAYVGLQAPTTDFIPATYTLPEVNADGYMYNTAGVLSFVEGITRYELLASAEIVDAIPAGYRMTEIIIFNQEPGEITVSIGKTLHGEEILSQENIAGGGWLSLPSWRYFSKTSATSLFFELTGLTTFGVVVTIDKKFIYIP